MIGTFKTFLFKSTSEVFLELEDIPSLNRSKRFIVKLSYAGCSRLFYWLWSESYYQVPFLILPLKNGWLGSSVSGYLEPALLADEVFKLLLASLLDLGNNSSWIFLFPYLSC